MSVKGNVSGVDRMADNLVEWYATEIGLHAKIIAALSVCIGALIIAWRICQYAWHPGLSYLTLNGAWSVTTMYTMRCVVILGIVNLVYAIVSRQLGWQRITGITLATFVSVMLTLAVYRAVNFDTACAFIALWAMIAAFAIRFTRPT